MKMGIDAVIDKAITAGKTVGTVVIVVKDGETVYSRAAGYADREIEKATDTRTIFRLASVTKPLVAATALALVDKGRLALSDLARDIFPISGPGSQTERSPISPSGTCSLTRLVSVMVQIPKPRHPSGCSTLGFLTHTSISRRTSVDCRPFRSWLYRINFGLIRSPLTFLERS